MSENDFINEKKEDYSDFTPFTPHPLCEVSEIIPVEKNGADVYLAMGRKRYQLEKQTNDYQKEEYIFKGKLIKDQEFCFVHKNGKPIPVNNQENCGYTLKGNARNLFSAKNALIAYSPDKEDETYIYINENSAMFYTGESKNVTIYMRIYDNREGLNNDRWVVLFVE